MIISSQPPSAAGVDATTAAGASIRNGLAATTITLQHCISRTATRTAQLIIAAIVVVVDAAIYSVVYPIKFRARPAGLAEKCGVVAVAVAETTLNGLLGDKRCMHEFPFIAFAKA
jgi:hypothetical protein